MPYELLSHLAQRINTACGGDKINSLLYQEAEASVRNGALALPTFAPVLALGAEQPAKPALNVTLPNGIRLELLSVALSDLPLLLSVLAEQPCSVSNRD